MGLETGSFIDDLVETNPVGATDPISEGDNHLRLLKTTLKNTFPGMAGAGFRVQSKSAAYTVVANDNTSLIRCTATLTLTLTAAATLGNQHIFYIINDSRGLITIDPNSAELINGHRQSFVFPGVMIAVFCDGTGFYTIEDEIEQVNPIFNSGFEIWQQWGATSATVSAAQRVYGPDGFLMEVTGVSAQVVMFRGTNVPTVGASQFFALNSLEVQNKLAKAAQSASTHTLIEHQMEGYEYQRIAQRPFWFSFWVHSSQTGTYNINIKNAGRDRTFVDWFVISAANTLEYKEFLIDAPPSAGTWDYSSGTGLVVSIVLGASATQVARQSWTSVNAFIATANVNWNSAISASFGIVAPHINIGSKPSLWRNYGLPYELERAYRYYQKSFDMDQVPAQSANVPGAIQAIAGSIGLFLLGKDYLVEMRTTPTLTLYNPEASNSFVRNTSDNTDRTVTVVAASNSKLFNLAPITVTAADADNNMQVHFSSDARL